MTSIILKMDACLKVELGMQVYYNCPSMSTEDYRSDQFFRKHSGKMAKIVGFGSEYVGILDDKGRTPGVYCTTGHIDVQFDGEDDVHTGLNINHFILTSSTTTVDPDAPLTHQRVSDLPNPIMFYPGDTVCKTDDLLGLERVVQRVDINKQGILVYILAETEDDRKVREAEKEASRAKRRESGNFMLGGMMNHEKTESCSGDQIKMITPGNLYWLYRDPQRMQFTSIEDEVYFWTRDGLSQTVFIKKTRHPQWRFNLDNAKALFLGGKADIVVHTKKYKNIVVTDKEGKYETRLLLPNFETYRARVRELSSKLSDPVPKFESTAGDSMRSFAKSMMS